MDPALEELASNAYGMIRDTYQKWLDDQTMVCCIMRATMNDKFSHKFENAWLEKIFQILNESFKTLEDA